MQNDVHDRVGEEACGLVAGLAGQSTAVYEMTNILHSPIRFQLDPREQFRVFQSIEDRGWDLLAIYHSHPLGPAGLSASDIEQAYYPEAAHLVWFPEAGSWTCNAYLVRDRTVQDVFIEILEESADP
jgi:proteasome lid subunit RPN8/RPN11